MSWVRLCGASTLALVIGCSLVVDASDIDELCGPGRKLCGDGQCVEISDPAYGCTSNLCAPCPVAATAIPACRGDVCIVKACVFGFGCSDCRKNILADEEHCGGCNQRCLETMSCQAGRCMRASM